MQEREPRRRVLLSARMQLKGDWVDVSIRNLSSRGMMIHSGHVIEEGTAVEIRRGAYIVRARSVWCRGGSVGLQADEQIELNGIPGPPEACGGTRPDGTPERRHWPRLDVQTGDQQVSRGKLLRAAGLGVTFVLTAAFVVTTAPQALAAPDRIVGAGVHLDSCGATRFSLDPHHLPGPCDFGLARFGLPVE